MKLNNRYSLFKRRYNLVGSAVRRRLGKSPDEGRLRLSSVMITVAGVVLLSFDSIIEKIDLPYVEWLFSALCFAVFVLSIYLEFRRRAPRPCWEKATWASAAIALVWLLFPWALYWVGEIDDMALIRNLSIASVLMWIVCLGCYLRLRFVRRRSRAEIARMHLREKRRRKMEYL